MKTASSVFTCTHVIYSVPDYEQDKLEQAQFLRKPVPGLTPIVFCTNRSDAEVCRETFQRTDRKDMVYGIVELAEPFDMP